MSVRDLRDWIGTLEKAGELVRVRAEVDPHLEITEIADRAMKSGGPALLFTNVKGSGLPVLINQFGSERRMCMALGTDSLDALAERIGAMMELQPPQGMIEKVRALGKLRELASFSAKTVKEAPCQEVWLDEPDLDLLPILTCWPDDGGPFVTLPLVFSRDPVTGARNCGMYRIQKVDRRTAMMHWQIHKDGAAHLRDSRGRVPVAVAIGAPPGHHLLGHRAAAAGHRRDDLRGLPARPQRRDGEAAGRSTSRCRPSRRSCSRATSTPPTCAPRGPFGDHTGFYTPLDDYPTFHLTGMSMRRDAVYAPPSWARRRWRTSGSARPPSGSSSRS